MTYHVHYAFHAQNELQISIPDNQLESLLKREIDLENYIKIDWEQIEKDYGIKNDDSSADISVNANESSFTYYTIEKNGIEHEWDGKSLSKKRKN
jgi:hypothetical protein